VTVHPIRPWRERIKLAPREAQILKLILDAAGDGRQITDAEIAAECGNGLATVKTLNRRLFVKFGVHSKPELIFLFYNRRQP
jgi:DNA-binding CsgD family transcriptional regulator